MKHRENIETCQSYEEFKIAQLKYIDYLIASSQAKSEQDSAIEKYVGETMGFVTRTEWLAVSKRGQDDTKGSPSASDDVIPF